MMGHIHTRLKFGFIALFAAMLAITAPQTVFAQETVGADVPAIAGPDEVPAGETEAPDGSGAYTPLEPVEGKGMPTAATDDMLKSMTFQDQYTDNGIYALNMHDYILMPVITAISIFVLALLLWVIVRYNRRANPEPSKTTHNTLIEVVWTIVPALILVVIAVPSITLLARQYETPPEDAITIKATGYQWYWGYSYPDHGDVEIISNMLSDADAIANGEPAKLAVDNRMVVPAGVPLRIQTTAADVIHAFAVPSLWFKMDAVPGRLNEKLLTIKEPGLYYGQCSELCGARHGYMPIAVEALPMEEFEAWVLEQGGSLPGAEEAAAEEEVAEDTAEAAPAA
ncbi:cytochrome c oxidase subunit II [Erythrobacter sp. F6033]|uniref:cytochrome c oxidase subunit II n=1 Tax=Erythrobacter sp. F6033 TaxID=2926401 RepID=UPI001FF2F6B5|nr:cytochrome c oxidase subunit II [Erythrobacter sp. F6033]MCK0128817.1 cytochrome c oxidase subunit II [Erythrobacter sp. F6033]